MEPDLFLLLLLPVWVLSFLPLPLISAAAVGVDDTYDSWGGQNSAAQALPNSTEPTSK